MRLLRWLARRQLLRLLRSWTCPTPTSARRHATLVWCPALGRVGGMLALNTTAGDREAHGREQEHQPALLPHDGGVHGRSHRDAGAGAPLTTCGTVQRSPECRDVHQVNELVDVKTSVNDFVIKACAKALVEVCTSPHCENSGARRRFDGPTGRMHASCPNARPAVSGVRSGLQVPVCNSSWSDEFIRQCGSM